ncbi:MAG: hypothetical protein QXW37_06705 [Candidatus Nitrosotenuis sp.]
MSTDKITRTTILASLIFSMLMISVIGTNTAFAHHLDYAERWLQVDGQIEKLKEDSRNINQEIEKLKKTSQNEITNQRISQLEQEILIKSAKINEYEKELNRLQQLNIESFKVPLDVEKKLYGAEKSLIDKYTNVDSTSYIGKNPVTMIFADLQHREMVVLFDPSAKPGSDKLTPTNILVDMRKIIGTDIPIRVEYGAGEPIACASRTSVCDPMKAGIQIADTININANGTLGFKSSKGTKTGFVTAGHVAGALDRIIEQPVNNRDVGKVTAICWSQWNNGDTCDYAFVELYASQASNINNNVYYQPTTDWTFVNRIADANQSPGTMVKKSGVGSGITAGSVYANSPNYAYNVVQLVVQSKDSGSPVFYQPGASSSVDLYGTIYYKVGQYARYHPWDYIKATLGLNE